MGAPRDREDPPYTELYGLYHSVYPQVANFDEDPDPEVLLATNSGIWLLEADGTVVYSNWRPTGEQRDWQRPISIHDFDADGDAELTLSSEYHFGVYEVTQEPLWVADIVDESGASGGTAFDFLGSGLAQSIYADEYVARVFDDAGGQLMGIARSSLTWIEYPTVADVDNDGSAEMLLPADGMEGWALRVIGDSEDRWVPARRIWNQHTYHVTNVLEDGTIPQFEQPSWLSLNTYRTQAQIGEDGVCQPEG